MEDEQGWKGGRVEKKKKKKKKKYKKKKQKKKKKKKKKRPLHSVGLAKRNR